MLIKGITNAGKTKFIEKLQRIFPCEEFVQQHGSPFDIDYKKQANYDHSRFKPSFVLIDEGAFTTLIDQGAIEDLKHFLGGNGRPLKIKNVTSTGRQWVCVPVIMTSNTLHDLMQPESFLQPHYFNAADQKRCEDKEAHRLAIQSRMDIVYLEQRFPGDGPFPYDEKDLAHYLYDMYLTERIQDVNSDLLVFEEENDQVQI